MANSQALAQTLLTIHQHLHQIGNAMDEWVKAYSKNGQAEDTSTATADRKIEIHLVEIQNIVSKNPELMSQTHFRTMPAAIRNLRAVLGQSQTIAGEAIVTVRHYEALLSNIKTDPADMNAIIRDGFPGF